MSTLAVDLQTTLNQLVPDSASKLERWVRDAIDLAQPSKTKLGAVDTNGWPIGYWEKFSGCLAGAQWDPPHGKVIINGLDLRDPRQPFWHGKTPDVKWPK